MKNVYIAAPFFNPEQTLVVEEIKAILDVHEIEYFSPKDESMFKQGDAPKDILDLNCSAIDCATLVIVVTDGKDVGAIWEAGYAYAKGKQILYVWLSREPDQKFNIMLAASGEVVHNYEDLSTQVYGYYVTGRLTETVDRSMLHE